SRGRVRAPLLPVVARAPRGDAAPARAARRAGDRGRLLVHRRVPPDVRARPARHPGRRPDRRRRRGLGDDRPAATAGLAGGRAAMMHARVPVESRRPIVTFSFFRLLLTLAALAGVLIFSVPHTAALAIFIGVAGVPWAAALYVLSDRGASLAFSPWVALVDVALIAGAELISPDTYAAVRFFALFLVAAHAQVQGDERGLAIAAMTCVVLVPI